MVLKNSQINGHVVKIQTRSLYLHFSSIFCTCWLQIKHLLRMRNFTLVNSQYNFYFSDDWFNIFDYIIGGKYPKCDICQSSQFYWHSSTKCQRSLWTHGWNLCSCLANFPMVVWRCTLYGSGISWSDCELLLHR